MRVLVIDAEYLVALEAEQVLVEALNLATEIAMPRDCVAAIRDGGHQVIILDAELVLEDQSGIVAALSSSQASLVFWSFDHEHLAGLPQWADVPVIAKPFDDQILIDTVRKVAEHSRQLM